MKKLILLAAAFMIVLSGCSKEEPPVTNPIGGGEQVKEQEPVQEPEREAVFRNEDIDQAKKMAQQYVAVITEFHGRTAHTTAELDGLHEEMSDKIKNSIAIHSQSRVTRISGTERNENDILELSASRFSLLTDEATEVYYENINVSELTIPMTYKIPGKYASKEPKKYTLHFVKTNENQVQLIRDGFFVSGTDLEEKDQESINPFNKDKLKNDLKIQ
ncbi:hypothetical protein [Paenibacillus sp. O199]|uniref:hypothetical protein n=1 Tax=Paenibacillus sp. O199 TaxID=1643925 RepID=UPI0007BEB2DF|nr:hypothetical protein [Paenibacillus sp. O199]